MQTRLHGVNVSTKQTVDASRNIISSSPDDFIESLTYLYVRKLQIFRFTAYILYPIALKLGRMIQNIGPRSRSQPDFSIFFQGAPCGRAPQNPQIGSLYISYPVELGLGRIIIDISLHNR